MIGPGARVTLHFTLDLAEGERVDSSRDGEPLTFTLGDGTLDPGLEAALEGLQVGDHQRLLLPPGSAFGGRDPANIHPLPRSDFSEPLPSPGTVMGFTTPSGHEVAGTVVGSDAETVQVDFNHPLAGRGLVFEVEILAVEPAS